MSSKRRRRNTKVTKKGKTKFSQKSLVTKILYILLWITCAGILALLTWGLLTAFTLTKITDQNFYRHETSVNIYDINDDFVTTLTENNSVWTELEDENGQPLVSQDYLNGVVATEDASFYSHSGINLIGIIKATFVTLFGNTDRGGSTITMQLAKLVYMDDWYLATEANGGVPLQNKSVLMNLQYKMTQMVYAIIIEFKYSKEEILTNYINTAYFGEPGYGVENASMYYFGKPSKDLELHEAAMLAGIPQMPSQYNPYSNPDVTKERRDIVLAAMLSEKYITQEEFDTAIKKPITDGLVSAEKQTSESFKINNGYIDQVRNELYKSFEDFDTSTAGMDVYTYLDPELQSDVYEIQNTDVATQWPDDKVQSGAISIDTQSGAIYAIGPGRNFEGYGGTNYATNYQRQPGSTAKPIVAYGPAVEYLKWSSWHPVSDSPIMYSGSDISINNADSNYIGTLSLQNALARSRNTTAVQTFQEVALEVGPEQIQLFMQNLGITDTGERTDVSDPATTKEIFESYAIGGWQYGTTPLELAGAYAAFANGGTYNEPHTIRKIEISENSPYVEQYSTEYEYEYISQKAMEPETAYIVNKMLDIDVPAAYNYGASAAGETAFTIEDQSVKTGTTDWGAIDRADLIRDRWVVGTTPNVTTAVWYGYHQEDEVGSNEDGHFIAEYEYGVYNQYAAIMQSAADSSNKLLHDGKPQTQPTTVISQFLSDDTEYPYPGGTEFYFITGSEDFKFVNGDVSQSSLATPSFTYTFDNENIIIDITDSQTDVSYNLYADNNLLLNTTDKQNTIKISDLFETASCTSNITLGITASDGENESGTVSAEVTNLDTSTCSP